jgi:hypothetical protein
MRMLGWLTIALIVTLCLRSIAVAFWPHNSVVFTVVGSLAGLAGGYRSDHGFWPWDRKRRKIERWRWLVETPRPRPRPYPRHEA